jgi:hypothetical protein
MLLPGQMVIGYRLLWHVCRPYLSIGSPDHMTDIPALWQTTATVQCYKQHSRSPTRVHLR